MDHPDHFLNLLIDGRYRLRRLLGSGSYGIVFAADEEVFGQVVSQVAVKIIPPEDEPHRQSVLKEILGLARLHHDYIINYRSSGEIRDGELARSIFLATELGDATLARLLKQGEPIFESEFQQLVIGVARALSHIHRAGHIHGDVKPANIIRVGDRWKLGDLGLLRSVHERATGPLLGSLLYACPEMLRREFAPANDVYALGVTVLFALTGRYPHAGETREEFVENLKRIPAKTPCGLKEPWKSLVSNSLLRDPQRRWTAETVADYLESAHHPMTEWLRSPRFVNADSLVVDESGDGNFTSLSEALAVAESGSRIVIRPGKYRDSILVDKALEIVGDGPAEEVIIAVRDGHCIEVATDESVFVKNLLLRTRPSEDGGECYAIEVRRGEPVFDQCLVRSRDQSAVAIHGRSRPTFRRCMFVDSGESGAFVFDGGGATFQECVFARNKGAGVTIGDGGQATFQRCDIRENQGVGAFLYYGGVASFDKCRVAQNGGAGAAVGGGGRGEFSLCTIVQNGGEGIWLHEQGTARVIGCDLRDNIRGPFHAPQIEALEQRDNDL